MVGMARRNNRNGQTVYCPACDELITFRKLPKRGNRINCPECDSLLTVVSLSPLQLTWLFEEPIEHMRSSRRNWVDATETGYEDTDWYEYDDEDYTYPGEN